MRPQAEGLSNRTLKRPPTAVCVVKADSMIRPACAGNCVSACKKSRISPWLTFAPSFICRARPRGDVIMRALPVRAQNSRARLRVPSVLPPSTMMISARTDGERHARVRGRLFSSFKVGMMTEIVIGSGWRTRCRASFSHHSEARRTKNVRLAFSFVAALPDTLLAILQA